MYTSTSSMSNKHSLINEWGNFLETIDWTFYCTLTTPYSMTVNSARRKIEKLHKILTERFSLENEIFWVAEPFDTHDSYHLHVLIKFKNGMSNKSKISLNKAWQSICGKKVTGKYNWTEIEAYVPSKGANFYVAEYLQRKGVEYGYI